MRRKLSLLQLIDIFGIVFQCFRKLSDEPGIPGLEFSFSSYFSPFNFFVSVQNSIGNNVLVVFLKMEVDFRRNIIFLNGKFFVIANNVLIILV